MVEPLLTVAMACHNDFLGLWPTIQSLRMHQPEAMPLCEILVVDNDPKGKQGQWNTDFVANWVAKGKGSAFPQPAKVTYVEAPEVEGTAAPRDLVFRKASGKYVLCMDCHVELSLGALARLILFWEEHDGEKDLVSGPIFMDDLSTYGTHFDDVWRDGMWGVWACAWQCPCGQMFCPREVARPNNQPPAVAIYPLMGGNHIPHCPMCERLLAVTDDWWGHENYLSAAGFRPLGTREDEPPFEIPAMGLGVFSMRRDEWSGFNPRFRGFGGEEGYLHEKVRQRGGKCLCLPFLRWAHRFTRKGQAVPYPLNTWHKVRNHVIGHQELGLPLDRLREEFVGRQGFPEDQWQQILDGAEWPEGHETYQPHQFARELERQEATERTTVPVGAGRLALRNGCVVVEVGAR